MNRSYLWTAFFMLVLVLAFLVSGGDTKDRLRRGALTIVGPALNTSGWFKQGSQHLSAQARSIGEIRDEWERLQHENSRLQAELLLLQELSAENGRLREMLGFKQNSNYRLLACRVVSRDPSNWWNSILVDRGTLDEPGLQADLPVVSPRGVVGKTGAVSTSVTEIILLVNENCKIAATSENSHDQGIVVGQGAMASRRLTTRMKYLPRNASLAPGERVLTNGLGGVFPPGLLVGIVSEVSPVSSESDAGLYREAVLEPAAALGHLDELFVVLGTQGTRGQP